MRGKLIVIDGLDGCGKSTLVKGLTNHLINSDKKVFNLTEFCKQESSMPEPEELMQYDVIISNEPTYTWIGKAIREEIIRNNLRKYTAWSTAIAFSFDREILYKRIIIPMLDAGKIVINDRSVTSSIVFQPIQDEPLTVEQVLSLEGNKIAVENRADLLIIATCTAEVAIERLSARHNKKDDVIFEKLESLKKAKERFESDWLREMFERRGAKVAYIDMSQTIAEEINQTIQLFESIKKAKSKIEKQKILTE